MYPQLEASFMVNKFRICHYVGKNKHYYLLSDIEINQKKEEPLCPCTINFVEHERGEKINTSI
jgi:hypothetical protein